MFICRFLVGNGWSKFSGPHPTHLCFDCSRCADSFLAKIGLLQNKGDNDKEANMELPTFYGVSLSVNKDLIGINEDSMIYVGH